MSPTFLKILSVSKANGGWYIFPLGIKPLLLVAFLLSVFLPLDTDNTPCFTLPIVLEDMYVRIVVELGLFLNLFCFVI